MEGKRGWILIITLLLVFPVAWGIGMQSTAEAKELKIAVITALSGSGANWGRGILHGAELASDEVNAQGGLLVGGEKYTITLIPYDDKYTAQGGAAAVHKAVFSDKVKIIIGSISSASVLAMQEVTEKEKILLYADSWAREPISPQKPYTFRPFMTSTQAAPGMARWAKKAFPQVKTVVTVAANDASGWSIGKDYEEAYKKEGFKVLTEFPERGIKDLFPLLTKYKGTDAGIFQDCALGVGTAALLHKQIKEMGLKATAVGGAWVDPNEFIRAAGGAEMAEGYAYPVVFDRNSKDPAIVDFIKKFQKKYGEKAFMDTPDPSFYDGTRLLFAALQKAGTVEDTDKIRLALESIEKFQGVLGEMRWGGKETYGINHQIIQHHHIAQVQNGKEVIIKRAGEF
jgi:branched-chain amino acid transport system substrate-binding protein